MAADHRAAVVVGNWLPLIASLLFVVLIFAYGLARQRKHMIPPRPTEWLTDTSGVLTNLFVGQENAKLEQWYQKTGHRLVVYIAPSKTEPTQTFDAYTHVLFDSWGVGRVPENDGIVLFIFTADDMRWIRVGWGLLDAIPDAEATRICTDVIKPLVHLNQWQEAVHSGINAITADVDTWDATH